MNKEQQIVDFLKNLSLKIDNLNSCVEFCHQQIKDRRGHPEIVVIASSLLRVFYEIEHYLDEWKRLQTEVYSGHFSESSLIKTISILLKKDWKSILILF